MRLENKSELPTKMSNYLEKNNPDLTRLTDEEILARSTRSPSLFKIIIDRFQASFLRTSNRILRSEEDAEEVVQDAFVKIYKNAPKFKNVEGGTFKSWAFKILINTSINRYHVLKRASKIFVELEDNDKNVPFKSYHQDVFWEASIKAEIYKVLYEMPENLRETLHKYYFEEKSIKEIADMESKTAAAIKTRLFRARKYFKKIAQKDNLEKIWMGETTEI